MKKTLTLSAVLLFAAFVSNGQCQSDKGITLTSDNVGLAPGTIHEHSASIKKVKLPSSGENESWDYSGLTGGSAITYGYVKNTDKSFSKTAVIDTGIAEQFDSTAGDTYPSNIVYDEDSKGLFFAGFKSPRTPTYLQTGYVEDSLVIDNQASLPSERANIIEFPASYKSTWSSSYNVTTKFTMTLEELGWYNVKCTEVQYTVTKDDVVGYGDLKTPSGSSKGGSQESDALMVKQSVITTDSLFVGAVPTDAYGIDWYLGYPTTAHEAARYGKTFVNFLIANFGTAVDPYGLMAAQGVTEGMPTVTDYSEIFYISGAYRPALTLDFGADSKYSTLVSATYRIDDQNGKCGSVALDEAEANNGNLAQNGTSDYNLLPGSNNNLSVSNFTAYPNPVASGATLTCRFTKNTTGNWNLHVCNSIGQIVKTIPVSGVGNMSVSVPMDNAQSGGLYFINLLNETGQQAASARFIVGGKN